MESRSAPVVVVGAGSSGCACALALASRGQRVVLVNSSLDSVGLPAYGPVVGLGVDDGADGGGSGRLASTLREAAPGVAGPWVEFAWESGETPALAIVDRRAVSLAVKWRLETDPRIDIRQAIVTGIDPGPGGGTGAIVRTAFGEIIEGAAVVLAVGLALGGRTRVGDWESAGGRLGEVSADSLLESLRSLGAEFVERAVSVGARVLPDTAALATFRGDRALAGVRRVGLRRVRVEDTSSGWTDQRPADERAPSASPGPPSPYEDAQETLVALVALPEETGGGGVVPILTPDGLVTGEWYVSPGAERAAAALLGGEVVVTRPAHEVRGHVAVDAMASALPWVRFTGQAAGAETYVESLSSGWRTGVALAADLAEEAS